MNKLLWFIMMILLLPLVSATTYYYSQSGDDSKDCTDINFPCKTIVDVNTKTLYPGDSVLFKCGDTWRVTTDAYVTLTSGNISGYITYGAYGTGNKPEFWQSLNMSYTTNWTNSSNVWSAIIVNDVGSLIFNDEAIIGVRSLTQAGVNTQGEWFYNETTNNLTLYSTLNPATYYTHIEVSTKRGSTEDVFSLDNKKYIVISNLTVRYAAIVAIGGDSMHRIQILDNNIFWSGGDFQSGDSRYGNPIDISLNSSDVFISGNWVRQCYDGCITVEAWASGLQNFIRNIEISYNILEYGHYPIEYFSSYATSLTDNITIHHNTFAHGGEEWSYAERPDGTSRGYSRFANSPGNTSNFTIRDNIFFAKNLSLIKMEPSSTTPWASKVTLDYNLYYNDTGTFSMVWNNTGPYYSLVALQTAFPLSEVNGYQGNPIFANNNSNYTPAYNSPACNMSSTGDYVGAIPCADAIPSIVYINKSHPSCSDSNNRETAKSTATPWCGVSVTTMDKVASGDTVYIANGIYTDRLRLRNKGGNITISAYPGDNPILFRASDLSYYNLTGTWTNVTTPGSNFTMWRAPLVSTYDRIYVYINGSYSMLYPASAVDTYCNNSICSPSPNMTFYWFNNTLPYDASWFNNSADMIYVKFSNLSKNPNTMSLLIGGEYNIQIDNITRLNTVFKDLTIIGAQLGAYVASYSHNITFENNRFIGGDVGIQISAYSGNITIQNNSFIFTKPDIWSWADEHDLNQVAVLLEHGGSNVRILNNTIRGYNNAVQAGYVNDARYLEVAYNDISFITDDVFEPEDYATCYNFHHNIMYSSHVIISMTPSNSSGCTSNFSYNIGIANQTSPGGTMRVFKFSNGANAYKTQNWKIDHNTLSGNDYILQSATGLHLLNNMNFTNNIFYKDTSGTLIQQTGTAADLVYWNNNIYYSATGNNVTCYYMNDTNSTCYTTIELAKGSTSWNGIWDSGSVTANPLFETGTFRPYSNSPACLMSSTGSYVGALPCGNTSAVPPITHAYCTSTQCFRWGTVSPINNSIVMNRLYSCSRTACT